MNTYLGIDIGGTAVKVGLVDEKGTVLSKAEQSVIFDRYKTPIMDTVVKSAKEFISMLEKKHPEIGKPVGVAVSATGQIDSKRACVMGTAGHIPEYDGTQFKDLFGKCFGLPVTALNDAKSAVLAESWVGSARGCSDVVLVVIGTGIGGGVVSGGNLITGRRGFGGEVGHMIIAHNGEKCSCGNHGCYEYYGSVKRLVETVTDAVKSGRISESLFLGKEISGKSIFEFLSGTADASEEYGSSIRALGSIVDEWESVIADGLVSLIHTFEPEKIIIGGGVSNAGGIFLEPLRKKVTERIMPLYREGLRIETAALGNDAGIIGAVRYHILQMATQDTI